MALRCLILSALLLALRCPAAPPEQVFTVRIKASVEGVGLSARKAALEKAEREALAEAIESIIESADLSRYRAMLDEAPRYIRQTRVLHTETVGQNTDLEADVVLFERPLRHDLATLMLPHLPQKPAIRILFAESIADDSPESGPVFEDGEKILRERFSDFGFTVKGIHDLLDQYDMEFLAQVTGGDRESGASFARSCLEEVVIVGASQVFQEAVAPGSNMLRSRAETTLRVFSGQDGKLQDTLYAQAVVQSADPGEGALQAVQDSCAKLAGECIVAAILSGKGQLNGQQVIVTVEQPQEEERITLLLNFLQTLEGVEQATLLFYAPGQARLRLLYPGSMASLADMLTGIRLQDKRAEVTRCVGRELTLSLF
ncbi:MAG TPA: hypothetical protein PLY90_07755 [Candidatus Hydrogenedentes bacterium]|jgi:hypothetical protein|nr:hypothetical protein [Candidatus Hydrogenedentota bacterium]HQB03177.1 hypothetical protein [Candidatus Hydrogenedentota bacterium]